VKKLSALGSRRSAIGRFWNLWQKPKSFHHGFHGFARIARIIGGSFCTLLIREICANPCDPWYGR
jgi:hypothetical protein